MKFIYLFIFGCCCTLSAQEILSEKERAVLKDEILFLQGAGLLFRSSYETSHIRRTIHKDSVSQKTIDAFKDTRIWKAEIEFYEFARSHFDVIKNELTAAESGGANKRIYHYEKTRP